uniref:Transmembrane protein 244 n=1 Tax=Leptobrachium leishanense TaxID=445787 RepID=A0A8C5LN36_9ANUR
MLAARTSSAQVEAQKNPHDDVMPLFGRLVRVFCSSLSIVVSCPDFVVYFHDFIIARKSRCCPWGGTTLHEIICANLILCLTIFYIVFYMTCSVCTGVMRMEHFNWRIPFEHEAPPVFDNTDFMVHMISLEITCFLSGILFVPIGRSWVWDYAFTIIILHVCICCAVTGVFPLMWQWWLEIGFGLVLIIASGQSLAQCTLKGSSKHPLTHYDDTSLVAQYQHGVQ